MNRMTAIFEWPERLGPRWFNQDNLETLLYSPNQVNEHTLRVLGVTFAADPLEQLEEERIHLVERMKMLDMQIMQTHGPASEDRSASQTTQRYV